MIRAVEFILTNQVSLFIIGLFLTIVLFYGIMLVHRVEDKVENEENRSN